MNDILIQTVIPIIVSLISAFVLLVVRNTDKWLKAKLSSEQYSFVSTVVATAVGAAEQYAGSGEGERKKQMVLQAVTEVLDRRGIHVNAQELDILIENSVRKEFAK